MEEKPEKEIEEKINDASLPYYEQTIFLNSREYAKSQEKYREYLRNSGVVYADQIQVSLELSNNKTQPLDDNNAFKENYHNLIMVIEKGCKDSCISFFQIHGYTHYKFHNKICLTEILYN